MALRGAGCILIESMRKQLEKNMSVIQKWAIQIDDCKADDRPFVDNILAEIDFLLLEISRVSDELHVDRFFESKCNYDDVMLKFAIKADETAPYIQKVTGQEIVPVPVTTGSSSSTSSTFVRPVVYPANFARAAASRSRSRTPRGITRRATVNLEEAFNNLAEENQVSPVSPAPFAPVSQAPLDLD